MPSGWKRLAGVALLLVITACPGEKPHSRKTPSPASSTSLEECGPQNPDRRVVRTQSIYPAGLAVWWAVRTYYNGCSDALKSILRTVDAGKTWKDVTPVAAVESEVTPAFLGGDRAWVIANSVTADNAAVALMTKDGGKTWTRGQPFTMFRKPNGSVDFVDPKHGWIYQDLGAAAGSQGVALYRSDDGGVKWSTATLVSPDSETPGGLPFGCNKSISFSDAATAWAAGICGTEYFLMVSRDRGKAWTKVSFPYWDSAADALVEPPVFFSARHGVVVAARDFSRQNLARTTAALFRTGNEGRSWSHVELPFIAESFKGSFRDPFHWWLLRPGRRANLFRTSDSGKHWDRIAPEPALDDDSIIFLISTTTAFALSPDEDSMLKTTDGGRHWRPYVLTVR
jgi:photosystem II stability/assembly factor-like uncharacterized protein